MTFEEEFDKHQEESSRVSDFYKFKAGDNKFRIMTEPYKKVSRWGHGICYEGAPYCDPAQMEKEYREKQEQAKKEGKDLKKVTKPSLSTKWVVWAIDRATKDFVILELPTTVAEDLRNYKSSEDYKFEGWPMPYDVTVVATGKVGTVDVKYKLHPARKESPVTEEELNALEKKVPIPQIFERIKAKQKAKVEGVEVDESATIEYPEESIDPNSIPFN